MILFVCFMLFAIICIYLILRAVFDGIDNIPIEYDLCDDCSAGWCDAFPNDEECRKWREEHNGKNDTE